MPTLEEALGGKVKRFAKKTADEFDSALEVSDTTSVEERTHDGAIIKKVKILL